jgi:general secretion pathway protein K
VKRQSGVALITAILVVALASIAAAAMLASANLAIHRASTLSDTERAWWYADGIEAWVKAILDLDRQNNKIDHLGEPWAKPVDYLPVDEGSLRGGIADLQGRFNLNNLSLNEPGYNKYKRQFERLLQNIEGAQQMPVEGLADAIHDWTDAGIVPVGYGGAEDGEYSSLQPPYRAANRQMTSVSELLAVRGMTKQLYLALRPHVCALPVKSNAGTAINVNTATLPVLLSLSDTPPSSLGQFVETRAQQPAEDPLKFWSDNFPGQERSAAPDITTSTEYFLLQGEAFIGSSHLALYSVVHRPKENGLPAVISRSQDFD